MACHPPPPGRHSGIGLELLIGRLLKTRAGRIVASFVSCLAATVALAFLFPIGLAQWRLGHSPTFTQAAVLDTQTFYDSQHANKATGYAVRYRFDAAGHAYGFRGPAGNEWAYVPEAVMDAAARSRRIAVAYLAADPWNNVPAVRLSWLWLWGVSLMSGSIALTAATWLWVARVARADIGGRATVDGGLT